MLYPSIDYYFIKKAALILNALDHKLRQQIIRILVERTTISVTEIYLQLQIEQAVTSQHLAILRRAGIVSTKRVGRLIYYTINPARIKAIENFASNIIKC